jgi:hypothetical protein
MPAPRDILDLIDRFAYIHLWAGGAVAEFARIPRTIQ